MWEVPHVCFIVPMSDSQHQQWLEIVQSIVCSWNGYLYQLVSTLYLVSCAEEAVESLCARIKDLAQSVSSKVVDSFEAHASV